MASLTDQYITQADAAREIDVEYHTVARWIREGKIHAEKIGGVVLIRKADLVNMKRSPRGGKRKE